MLRLIVLVLVLLNLGYFARGQGWLQAYGWGPTQQREPQRLAQQIHPEALTVLPPKPSAAQAAASVADAAPDPAPAAPAPTSCWQAPDLDEAQADTLRPLLAAKLTAGAWALDETRLPARWMLYMGPYSQAADLAKKREQLTDLKVKFFALTGSGQSPGFSLGIFSSQEAAKAGLQDLAKRGVHSARVLQERAASVSYHLRLPSIGTGDQAALDSIKAVLPSGKLALCPPTGAAAAPDAAPAASAASQ